MNPIFVFLTLRPENGPKLGRCVTSINRRAAIDSVMADVLDGDLAEFKVQLGAIVEGTATIREDGLYFLEYMTSTSGDEALVAIGPAEVL